MTDEQNEQKKMDQLKEDFIEEIMRVNAWSREDAEALCNMIVTMHEKMNEASRMMWEKSIEQKWRK